MQTFGEFQGLRRCRGDLQLSRCRLGFACGGKETGGGQAEECESQVMELWEPRGRERASRWDYGEIPLLRLEGKGRS